VTEGEAAPAKLIAIITCHNRREATLACMHRLAAQRDPRFLVEIVLVDDGSTDGTADAVKAKFPEATVLRGDGNLYWARGMALAESRALKSNPDVLLWLNDDVALADDALARLWDTHLANPGAIIAGATVDSVTGKLTYGAHVRTGRHPCGSLRALGLSDQVQEADTFNGNVVLVPRSVVGAIGGIDGVFDHAYADTDYGLRARQAGISVLQASGAVGSCELNPGVDLASMTLAQRWSWLRSRKGLPLRSQVRLMRRHAGIEWPAYVAYSYAKRLFPQRRGSG